eukprot:TRINITY_DN80291_c0_g1_i1.p1 TRINITY_DN80291_c0_g1~~TRINITY_DN80291_c0_g1_i1.p1  ORF type:complete len:444 (-),score=88.83 TRINITY_DN80291_c0_g1_i1:81-1271(-)
MAGAEAKLAMMQPPRLIRSMSEGGIPLLSASDVQVLERSRLNFDGLEPATNRLWFGPLKFVVQREQYDIASFIGSGAEGQTYLAVKASTGKKYCIKFCNDRNSMEVDLIRRMPRQLVRHPNFLTYEFVVSDVGSLFSPAVHMIMMEFVPNGELFEILAAPTVAEVPVSQGTARRFIRDVIAGMAECYRFGVTHRDLKPENLLVNEEGRVVIIDLGHAKRAPPVNPSRGDLAPPPLARTTTSNVYGTAAFSAPEVRMRQEYNCELSDVWSIGVIAFYLHSKLPAFQGGGGCGSFDQIAGKENNTFWQAIDMSGYYRRFPDDMRAFINALWQRTPEERPSFEQMERAIMGDEEVFARFEGLRWLAQPENSVEDFLTELRTCRPDKNFHAPAAAGATHW